MDEKRPFFNVMLDPKEDWAVRHLECFPVEINRHLTYIVLRVPGIGVKSARRILSAQEEHKAYVSGSEEAGRGDETGCLFYYLWWQDDVSDEAGGGLYRAESDGSEGTDPVRQRWY